MHTHARTRFLPHSCRHFCPQVLCLSHNRLRRLPAWLAAMQKVRILKIDDNPIQYPPPHVSIFSSIAAGGPLVEGGGADTAGDGSADTPPASAQEERERRRAQDKAMQAWITRLKAWLRDNPDSSEGAAHEQSVHSQQQQQRDHHQQYHHHRGQSSLDQHGSGGSQQIHNRNHHHAHHHRGKSSLASGSNADTEDSVVHPSASHRMSHSVSSSANSSGGGGGGGGAGVFAGQHLRDADDDNASSSNEWRSATPETSSAVTSPVKTSPERSFRMRPLMLARQQNASSQSSSSATTTPVATPTASKVGGRAAQRDRDGEQPATKAFSSSRHSQSASASSSLFDLTSPADDSMDNLQQANIRGQRAQWAAAAQRRAMASEREERKGHSATDSESSSGGGREGEYVIDGDGQFDGHSSSAAAAAAVPTVETRDDGDDGAKLADADADAEDDDEDDDADFNDANLPTMRESSSQNSLLAPGSSSTVSPSRSVTPTPHNQQQRRQTSQEERDASSADADAGIATSAGYTTASTTPRYTVTASQATTPNANANPTMLTPRSPPRTSMGPLAFPRSSLAMQQQVLAPPPPPMAAATEPPSPQYAGPLSSLPSFDRPPRRAPPTPTATPAPSSHGRNNSHSYGQAISPLGQASPPSAKRRLLRSKKSLPDMRGEGHTSGADRQIDVMPAMKRGESAQSAMTRDLSMQSAYSHHSTPWSLASSTSASAGSVNGPTPPPPPAARSSPVRPRLKHAATADGIVAPFATSSSAPSPSPATSLPLPLLPALDVDTQSVRKASAPAATPHLTQIHESPPQQEDDTGANGDDATSASPAQVLEQRRADVVHANGLKSVDPPPQRVPSRRRRALLGAAGLSDDEGASSMSATASASASSAAVPRSARALDTATNSQEFQRDSYFKRFSTFHSLMSAPAVAPTTLPPPSTLKMVDATRGILFALSQIYTALKQYTLFARDEGVSAQLARVLDVAAGTLAALIDALDRFDALSLRGQVDEDVTATVLDASRDSVQIFRKVVNVLQLQLKPLQATADVRYSRSLILMLYGAMTEVSQSWREICVAAAAEGDAIPHQPPQLQRAGGRLGAMTTGSNGVAPQPPLAGAFALPSIAESTSPVGSFKREVNEVNTDGEGDADGEATVDANATPSRPSARPQRKRHAGSFSAQDVRSGSMMPAAPPPLPDDVLALEYRGPPVARRQLGRRVATDTTGALTQGQQLHQHVYQNGVAAIASSAAMDPTTPARSQLQQSRSVSNPHLVTASNAAMMQQQQQRVAVQHSRPIVDYHLLSLVQQVTSTASGVWVALLEHLSARGVRGQQQQQSPYRVVSGGSPDVTPTLAANRVTGVRGGDAASAASNATLSPPPRDPVADDVRRSASPSTVASLSSPTPGSHSAHASNRKLFELREQCLSAAELTRRLQQTWEKVQDEVENNGGGGGATTTSGSVTTNGHGHEHHHHHANHIVPPPTHSRALNVNESDARRLLDEAVAFARAVTALLMSIKSLSITHESLTVPELKRALGALTAGCTNLSVHLHFCAPSPAPWSQGKQQQQVARAQQQQQQFQNKVAQQQQQHHHHQQQQPPPAAYTIPDDYATSHALPHVRRPSSSTSPS